MVKPSSIINLALFFFAKDQGLSKNFIFFFTLFRNFGKSSRNRYAARSRSAHEYSPDPGSWSTRRHRETCDETATNRGLKYGLFEIYSRSWRFVELVVDPTTIENRFVCNLGSKLTLFHPPSIRVFRFEFSKDFISKICVERLDRSE